LQLRPRRPLLWQRQERKLTLTTSWPFCLIDPTVINVVHEIHVNDVKVIVIRMKIVLLDWFATNEMQAMIFLDVYIRRVEQMEVERTTVYQKTRRLN